MSQDGSQRIRDEEHLRLLGIFYYILGGLSALFALFPLIYVFLGLFVSFIPEARTGEDEMMVRWVGTLFVVFGLGIFVVLEAFAALKIYAGYLLMRRRKRVVCLVIAGISCMGFPFGTVLGVFTFVVLLRDSVIDLFNEGQTISRPPSYPST